MAKITGGCFCGSVRYESDAAPLGSMICHCQTCRRVSGAPVVAWLTFEKATFRYTSGEPGTLQSSEGVTRAFCKHCGTPLAYAANRDPTELDITTCTLDDPNAFPPTHHSWISHDLRWVRFGDELPKYPESRHQGGE